MATTANRNVVQLFRDCMYAARFLESTKSAVEKGKTVLMVRSAWQLHANETDANKVAKLKDDAVRALNTFFMYQSKILAAKETEKTKRTRTERVTRDAEARKLAMDDLNLARGQAAKTHMEELLLKPYDPNAKPQL